MTKSATTVKIHHDVKCELHWAPMQFQSKVLVVSYLSALNTHYAFVCGHFHKVSKVQQSSSVSSITTSLSVWAGIRLSFFDYYYYYHYYYYHIIIMVLNAFSSDFKLLILKSSLWLLCFAPSLKKRPMVFVLNYPNGWRWVLSPCTN